MLQDFKSNNQIKPIVQRKEILSFEFNGWRPESRVSLMLGNQLRVQVETETVESPIDQIFKESAAAHSNLKEPARWHSLEKPVGKKTAVKVGECGIR